MTFHDVIGTDFQFCFKIQDAMAYVSAIQGGGMGVASENFHQDLEVSQCGNSSMLA